MNKTMREQLKDWTKNKKEYRSKPQKRSAEVLTESDIKSLMGVDKPVYRRHKGAFRQIR